jgi:hypothetical protein
LNGASLPSDESTKYNPQSRRPTTQQTKTMVKFGLRLDQNKASDYPPDAYVDYAKLKEIIHVLSKKKLAG